MNFFLIVPTVLPVFFLLLAIFAPPSPTQLLPPQFPLTQTHPTSRVLSATDQQPSPTSSPNTSTPSPSIFPAELPSPTSSPTASTLLNEINTFRASHGLSPLSSTPSLCQVASQRANQASLDFSHQQFYDLLNQGAFNHLNFNLLGENLYQGPADDSAIVLSWSQSDPHLTNLMGDWTSGCGSKHNQTTAFIFLK